MNTIESIRSTIKNSKTRSAWDKGVKLYALELLTSVNDKPALRWIANGIRRTQMLTIINA